MGQWTNNAIRILTLGCSTDVALDLLPANYPKIGANNFADEIVHDYASLKLGVLFEGELNVVVVVLVMVMYFYQRTLIYKT